MSAGPTAGRRLAAATAAVDAAPVRPGRVAARVWLRALLAIAAVLLTVATVAALLFTGGKQLRKVLYAPKVTLDSGPARFTNIGAAGFRFTVDQRDAIVECRLDGGAFSPCAGAKRYRGLEDGQHTFTVRAANAQRDTGDLRHRWTIDRAKPAIAFVRRPDDRTSKTDAALAWRASEAVRGWSCALDAQPLPCGRTASLKGLGRRGHAFVVSAVDRAGNRGEAGVVWTVLGGRERRTLDVDLGALEGVLAFGGHTVSCAQECTRTFPDGTKVRIEADAGDRSVAWSGCRPKGRSTCVARMDADRRVSATLAPRRPPLLTVIASEHGSVASEPAGIECPQRCERRFDDGRRVTLKANPEADYVLKRWRIRQAGVSSICADPCVVTMSAPARVTATFVPSQRLTVSVGERGSVTSDPAGLACESDTTCAHDFATGTPVALSATAQNGYRVKAWVGCDPPAPRQAQDACVVTIDDDVEVSVSFERFRRLTVEIIGAHGSVKASGAIDCPRDCDEDYVDEDVEVTLTATADPKHALTGWRGCDTQAKPPDPCVVTLRDAETTVTATFAPTTSGGEAGGGTVTTTRTSTVPSP